jgi:hypothetical protein
LMVYFHLFVVKWLYMKRCVKMTIRISMMDGRHII